jgi:hypothetical protein
MKKLLMILPLVFLTACAHDRPTPKTTPMSTNVLNESWVEVNRVEIPVDAAQTIHQGKERVIVSLNDYTIEWVEDGQKTSSKSWKRGDVHWHRAKDHAAKNIGTTPARFLVIAKKTPTKSAKKERKQHSKASKKLPNKVLENDFVVVTEVSLKPGEKQPIHQGDQRVIVALSDYEVLYRSGSKKDRKVKIKNESVHLHEADQHAVSNVGKTKAHYLIIQFK